MPETTWLAPSFDDLFQVISAAIIAKSNENIDADTLAQTLANPENRKAWDAALDDRATQQLALAVGQFRGAIQLCGKIPLSLTAGTIPPEVFKHVLWLAAYGILSSTLNLQWVIATEKGDISPITKQFNQANAYLELVTKGRICVPPSLPTGRDYLTAINVPWFGLAAQNPYPAYDNTKPLNPPVNAVRFGSGSFPVDLTTSGSIFGQLAPPWWPEGLGQP